jgi:hypothetical protein
VITAYKTKQENTLHNMKVKEIDEQPSFCFFHLKIMSLKKCTLGLDHVQNEVDQEPEKMI